MAPYLLTSRTSEQNPDPRLVASRNAVLCPRVFSALCLSLVRTPVFGFRARPNPGCSHLRIPAKNPFLNKVPPTGPGAKDVTPSFAGSRGTVQGRLGFPPSPSEQGILQTREGLGQRTRRMDNVRCRAPVCISRGEVTAPTWHASARGQRCLCPAPTAPLGSRPTARRLCQRRAEGAAKELSKLLQKTGLTSVWVAASVWPGRRWSGQEGLYLAFERRVDGGPSRTRRACPSPWPVRARISPQGEAPLCRAVGYSTEVLPTHTAYPGRRHPPRSELRLDAFV